MKKIDNCKRSGSI